MDGLFVYILHTHDDSLLYRIVLLPRWKSKFYQCSQLNRPPESRLQRFIRRVYITRWKESDSLQLASDMNLYIYLQAESLQKSERPSCAILLRTFTHIIPQNCNQNQFPQSLGALLCLIYHCETTLPFWMSIYIYASWKDKISHE